VTRPFLPDECLSTLLKAYDERCWADKLMNEGGLRMRRPAYLVPRVKLWSG